MEINANVKFFLSLAVQKAGAKLADKGLTAEQIAEWLTLPGHMVDLLNLAEDLHIQAFEKLEAQS